MRRLFPHLAVMRYVLTCTRCNLEQVYYSELNEIQCPKCQSQAVRVKVDAIT